MENTNDGFWTSVNEGAKGENAPLKGDLPLTGEEVGHINYEILPIQELRLEAEKLGIKDLEGFNKQMLIDKIRDARAQRS